jgi:sugar phosphate isomerase/epimerase
MALHLKRKKQWLQEGLVMIKTAFSTLSCPDWTWQELLDKGKRYDYDGVEIRLLCRETDLLKVPEFRASGLPQRRRELADAGFQVRGLASSVRFHDSERAVRDQHVQDGKAHIDLAKELGARFVRVFGDIIPEGMDRETIAGQVSEGLNRLGEYAEKLELDIVIETHGDFADSSLMQEAMKQVKSARVGVLWDVHHPWRYYGEDLPVTFRRIGAWVRHTHWKDSISHSRQAPDESLHQAAGQALALMGGHRHANYVLFGGGEFPAIQCMRLLRRGGYDGWHCLEWEKMWHPEIEDPEIALPLFPKKLREMWDLVAG